MNLCNNILGVFRVKGQVGENYFDSTKASGIYTAVMLSRERYGVLVVFNSGHFIIQLFGYSSGIMYRRFIYQDNFWNPWYELA